MQLKFFSTSLSVLHQYYVLYAALVVLHNSRAMHFYSGDPLFLVNHIFENLL